ncbi:hypothetical protein [Bradyrhizobium sp. JR3.5]
MLCERRNRDPPRRAAIKEALDLAVADHPVVQAGPACCLARVQACTSSEIGIMSLFTSPFDPAREAALVTGADWTTEDRPITICPSLL